MTVLILVPERDITADRMVKALEDRATPVARADTAWFPKRRASKHRYTHVADDLLK